MLFLLINYSQIFGNIQCICKIIQFTIYETMGVAVIFTYEPLWNTLKKKGISQYDLIKVHHVSTGTLDSLRKNKSVTMNTLHDLCIAIDCQIQDVVQVIKDNE